jgi:hypothetical protein
MIIIIFIRRFVRHGAKRMDRTETQSSCTSPEVSTKVSVSQIIFRFRAFGSCIIAKQPSPTYKYYPHLVLSKLSKSFLLAMKIQILEVIVQ